MSAAARVWELPVHPLPHGLWAALSRIVTHGSALRICEDSGSSRASKTPYPALRGTYENTASGAVVMARLYVTCTQCSHRNDRIGGRRKCVKCGAPFPKRRIPRHARTLRDDSYERYVELNQAMHGEFLSDPENCYVCDREKGENRRHDRDHDHRTGLPRGLACVRCNRELLRNSTLDEARLVVAALERVEEWHMAGRAAVSA